MGVHVVAPARAVAPTLFEGDTLQALPGELSSGAGFVAEMRRSLSEQSRVLTPGQMLELVEGLKAWVADEVSFEENAAASLGRNLSDLQHSCYIDQLPPLVNTFERLVSAHFVRRASVSAFHVLCNAWREAMIRRVLLLAEEGLELNDLGRPPAPYAVLAAGVAGRREQALEDSSRYFLVWRGDDGDYFENFAYRILAILDQSSLVERNVRHVLGKVLWYGSLTAWSEWIEKGDGDDFPARRLELIADLRFMGGDAALAGEAIARGRHHARLAREGVELVRLAKRCAALPVALRFPLRFRLEKGGEQDGSFHLVHLALHPLVAAVRLLALQHDLEPGLPTTRRIEILGDRGELGKDAVQRLTAAYELFTALKISREIVMQAPYVNPAELGETERQRLKKALLSVRWLQNALPRV